MKYVDFGQTGKKVSVVGFGGMRFPADDKECIKMLHRAVELGINYFDTAPMYCEDRSESIFGQGLKEFKDRIYISTKSSIGSDPKADDVVKRIEGQLKSLGVDRITFYHMWCVMDMDQFNKIIAPGGPYEGVVKAKKEGLIEHIMFSMHANGEEVEKMVQTEMFEGITLGYNVLNHSTRYQGIKAAHDAGLGVAVMNPMGGGLIAKAQEKFSYLNEGNNDTPTRAAIRFLLHHPEINVVLCGMGSLNDIEENVAVAESVITKNSETAEKLRDTIKAQGDNYCTMCKYCMPCPNGIKIPYYMFAVDRHHLNDPDGAKNWLKFMEDHGALGEAKPSLCDECGECVDKCTQKLPIIDRMKEAVELFGE